MKTIEFTDQGETHSPFDWNKDYFADDQNVEGDYHSDGDQNTEEPATSVFNIDLFADSLDTNPPPHHSTMTMRSIGCTNRKMRNQKTYSQATKDRAAHYIRRGFTQKDATADALLDARLDQPHTNQ